MRLELPWRAWNGSVYVPGGRTCGTCKRGRQTPSEQADERARVRPAWSSERAVAPSPCLAPGGRASPPWHRAGGSSCVAPVGLLSTWSSTHPMGVPGVPLAVLRSTRWGAGERSYSVEAATASLPKRWRGVAWRGVAPLGCRCGRDARPERATHGIAASWAGWALSARLDVHVVLAEHVRRPQPLRVVAD